jgi:hypothetical protein
MEPTVIHHVGVAQPHVHDLMAPSGYHVIYGGNNAYQGGTDPYPTYNNEAQAYATAYPNYLQ